jgi:serpin B
MPGKVNLYQKKGSSMNRISQFILACVIVCHAEPLSLSGTVKSSGGQPIGGAEVILNSKPSITSISNASGVFQLTGDVTSLSSSGVYGGSADYVVPLIEKNRLVFSLPRDANTVTIRVLGINGKVIHRARLQHVPRGLQRIALPLKPASGIVLMELDVDGRSFFFKRITAGESEFLSAADHGDGRLSKSGAAFLDSIIIQSPGYVTAYCPVSNYQQANMAITINPDSGFGDGEALKQRVDSTNKAAFKLYNNIRDTTSNIVFSPLSIVTLMGMAYSGARGATELQMAAALDFNFPQERLHTIVNQLNDTLVSRQNIQLVISNGFWRARTVSILPPFTDLLRGKYRSDTISLDFADAPEQSRGIINTWVYDHTMNRISNLLPPGSITSATTEVLANTVFFHANWASAFDPAQTTPNSFTRLGGTAVNVPFMHGESALPYYECADFQAMELPYKGKMSMLLVVPKDGRYKTVEDTLNPLSLDVLPLVNTHIVYFIPKFGFFSSFDLIKAMKTMGMQDAFAPGADFSGMDGTRDGSPWVSLLVHKAYIEIDEFGTLAAAATGMALSVGIHPYVWASRPFLFFVRDNDTKTILFMGRVMDPSAK